SVITRVPCRDIDVAGPRKNKQNSLAGRIVDAGSASFMLVGCTTLNVIIILGVLARFPLVAFTISRDSVGWTPRSYGARSRLQGGNSSTDRLVHRLRQCDR